MYVVIEYETDHGDGDPWRYVVEVHGPFASFEEGWEYEKQLRKEHGYVDADTKEVLVP